MKIKCPACGAENYFSGLEDEESRFCSDCNEPLFKIGKEKLYNAVPGSKQIINLQSSLEEIHEGIQLGTIEYKDIGKLLAEIFIKNILKSFDGKTFSWIHKDFKDTKKDTLLKEWVFLICFWWFKRYNLAVNTHKKVSILCNHSIRIVIVKKLLQVRAY